jgi:hypothetical protein
MLAQVLVYNRDQEVLKDFAFVTNDPKEDIPEIVGMSMKDFSFSITYSLILEPDGKDEIRGFGYGEEGFVKAISALESLKTGYFIHAIHDDGGTFTELTISPKKLYYNKTKINV